MLLDDVKAGGEYCWGCIATSASACLGSCYRWNRCRAEGLRRAGMKVVVNLFGLALNPVLVFVNQYVLSQGRPPSSSRHDECRRPLPRSWAARFCWCQFPSGDDIQLVVLVQDQRAAVVVLRIRCSAFEINCLGRCLTCFFHFLVYIRLSRNFFAFVFV